MIDIAHIVNPVAVKQDSRFYFIQQVTFKSMQIAKETCEKYAQGEININLYSAQFPEDRAIVPEGFIVSPDLDRSILDLYSIPNGRKLPFISDVISRVSSTSTDDIVIYTNVDIGLVPDFYRNVVTLIKSGYDAFTINRRSISDHYQSIEQLPLMYTDHGEPHRGWDCFVFRREICSDLHLGYICVGAPLIGLAMLANLMAFSKKFTQFTEEHWTFHLGNDRKWRDKANRIYARHNQQEIQRLLPELDVKIGGFPLHTPPAVYIRNHSNPIRAWIYDGIRSVYFPAKFIRPFNRTHGK